MLHVVPFVPDPPVFVLNTHQHPAVLADAPPHDPHRYCHLQDGYSMSLECFY